MLGSEQIRDTPAVGLVRHRHSRLVQREEGKTGRIGVVLQLSELGPATGRSLVARISAIAASTTERGAPVQTRPIRRMPRSSAECASEATSQSRARSNRRSISSVRTGSGYNVRTRTAIAV